MSHRKLAKYVCSGRLSRVKKLLRDERRRLTEEDPLMAENDAWMDRIKVKSRSHNYGDETHLLHFAAAVGDERVLRYLLKSGFGLRQGHIRQKGDERTPLHLAVARCQKTLKTKGSKKAIEDFQDYVKPVLDACQDALKVKDQFGQSGRSVLDELQTDIARAEVGPRYIHDDDDRDLDRDEDDDDRDRRKEERSWREKLRDECHFEMESSTSTNGFQSGAFGGWTEKEEDELRDRETFKEFAERIEREYRQRYRRIEKETEKVKNRKFDGKSSTSSSSSKLNKEIDMEKRRRYDEMKRVMTLKTAKLDYERRWETFFQLDDEEEEKRKTGDYSFDQLPWPKKIEAKTTEPEAIRRLVAEMTQISTFVMDEEAKDAKERERRLEMKRWHPDKVAQKMRVRPEDAEFVAWIVKELAQMLNAMKPTS